MSEIKTLADVAHIVAGSGFNEAFQGQTNLPIPFVKVSDFQSSVDNWLSSAANSVNEDMLKALGAKKYPAGTIIFPKVGGALLTNKRTRLAVESAMDNNVMGLIPLGIDPDYLFYFMCLFDMGSIANAQALPSVSASAVAKIEIPVPVSREIQRQIANKLKTQLAEVETARQALEIRQQEIVKLANAYIRQSIVHSKVSECPLGDVLDEVKKGIGERWADYPVLGATRDGLAPAKEPPGKQPQRYKPVFSGTVFYNPMRILIGSIAFVDDDDQPGITSPDYVALQGKPGIVDSRWFYYWLRSPYGVQCINSLARGAVRERMLFNRLAEGFIQLPPYSEQVRISAALKQLQPVKAAIKQQLDDLNKIPERLLAKAFDFNHERRSS
ncbi:restriction endonuclease subunit S [Methylomonas sp. OY6]|uniref:Restriction endonuclease subunit S n=1 Tax=Methylomonas defluvii TaxID=3045149 RepID=A0ABU4UKE4_9GAMM|nr:restriction endonuclease subunit S [Methylomonas sp. OY6]MDX8129870.1 restriction endonuclease subunit S [Methylomonas sp. OY6]